MPPQIEELMTKKPAPKGKVETPTHKAKLEAPLKKVTRPSSAETTR